VAIGLLSDPDLPTEIAEDLAEDLPELLAERIDDRGSWKVSTRREALPTGDVEQLIAVARDRRREAEWDVVICLTDLPLRSAGRPVVVDASVGDGVGVVSLPALGPTQLRSRAREAIVGLVGHLIATDQEGARGDGDARPLQAPVPAKQRHAPEDADSDLRLVASRTGGNMRLLAGMVRANRPWRLVFGLSSALSATVATAAIALMNVTVWQVGDALDPARLWLLTAVSLTAMVAWLILAHGLWRRASGSATREQVRLFNAATVLTLSLGVLWMYVIVFLVSVAAAELFIDSELLRSKLQHSIGLADYLALAWLVSSAATIGGALGSGLESNDAVRDAAYGHDRQDRRR
jgi:hypothetical protein